MHQRKVTFLGNLPEASMSFNISCQGGVLNNDGRLAANCWIKDSEGREIGLVLDHTSLIGIRECLNRIEAKGVVFSDVSPQITN